MMRFGEKSRIPRLVAFAFDQVVIAAWGGILFGIVMLFSNGDLKRFSSPSVAQGVGFLSMTLPVILYFGISESSRFRASIGKLIVGRYVCSSHGDCLALRQSFMRIVIKFVPWELGHLVAQKAMFSGNGGFPVWAYLPIFLSFTLPIWWVGLLLLKEEAPYDIWVRARAEKSDV